MEELWNRSCAWCHLFAMFAFYYSTSRPPHPTHPHPITPPPSSTTKANTHTNILQFKFEVNFPTALRRILTLLDIQLCSIEAMSNVTKLQHKLY